MKRWIWGLLTVIVVWSQPVWAGKDLTGAQWVPGRLVVDFRSEVGTLQDTDGKGGIVSIGVPVVDALLAKYHVTNLWRVHADGALLKLKVVPDYFREVVLECPAETDILAMMEEFERCPLVKWAEPDLIRPVCDRTPNDPLWSSQWDKRLMHLPRAWEFTTGSRDIIMVAIDGGTYWPHNDFYANLWVNPGEDVDGDGLVYLWNDYPGDPDDINGIDDDGNGKVDDLIGWDFIRNQGGCAPGEDCDSQEDNDPIAVGDHGTHVLGLMGAVGNNGIGVAGAAWNCRIMASRAGYTNASGDGYVVSTAWRACVIWAVGNGAAILNMSFGGPGSLPSESDAIQTCWNNGAVIVAAAGNDHVTTLHYPSCYPNVVAVGSVDSDDRVSDFSNYGTWLDAFAPGNMVMSTVIPGYTEYPGTSMASPNAAGVFGLIWSYFPELTNADLVDLVLSNCASITAQNPTYSPSHLGHGRIDAQEVLASVLPYVTLEDVGIYGDNDGDSRLEPGETGYLLVTLHNEAGWSPGQNLQVTIVSEDPNVTLANASFTMPTIAPGQSLDNTNTPVQVTAGPQPIPYWSPLRVQIRGPENLALDIPFLLRIGRPQTLLVADEGVSNYHRFFQTALRDEIGGYDYDLWTVDGPETELVFADVAEYDIIVWVCGDESSNTLTPANQTMLAQFLNGGGKLMLCGQNIDEDISASSFYADYLHCQSGGASGYRNLTGVAGDPISDGTTLLLAGGACGGNGLVGPSQISPVNGGVAFYNYTTGGSGAVRYDNGTYKTAYFAFALEAACGAAGTVHHSVVVHRVMEWFGATVTPVEPPAVRTLPDGYALRPNYPNPFNPVTNITFEIPSTMKVSLRVFDMLGRQVAVLLNGQVVAGSHTVAFDGSGLASGTYLAQFTAGDFSATQRMVLLK